MSAFKEFREFISRGSVVDLAVGVVIGAAFGKVVSSLVADVVMPPIGLALGGVDFSHLQIVLKHADPATKIAEVAIKYGMFLNTLIEFFVIAGAIFLMIKAINTLRRPAPEVAAATASETLLTEIRDLLATRRT
ncbi:MAG: large-conductance mechanosensitive channel protein MscL [Caulobacteraceae bacterium]